MDLTSLTDSPATYVVIVLACLILLTLYAPPLIFRLRITVRRAFTAFGRAVFSRASDANPQVSDNNLFDSEQQVTQLQARLEAELASDTTLPVKSTLSARLPAKQEPTDQTRLNRKVEDLNDSLRSLQSLVISQHKTIKKLESESADNQKDLTHENILKLTRQTSDRQEKIDRLSVHVQSVQKHLKGNPNSALLKQSAKLRVSIAKEKLVLSKELKKLGNLKMLDRALKLPESERAMLPVKLSDEIGALRKNNNELASVIKSLHTDPQVSQSQLESLRQDLKKEIDHNSRDGVQTRPTPSGFTDKQTRRSKNRGQLTALGSIRDGKQRPLKLTTINGSKPANGDKSKDNLKAIFGIGTKIEAALNDAGIKRFEQIAELSEEAIDHLAVKIGCLPDRIERDGWVESARRIISERTSEKKSGDAA